MKAKLDGVKALVTGGTGFIGRHLVADLISHHVDVTVLSRNQAGQSGTFRMISGDLGDSNTLQDVCRNVNLVFHLGGPAHVVGTEKEYWNVTVEGTRSILEQASNAGVLQFIFFSSVKAMGEGGEDLQDETCAHLPSTLYGRAKREAEQLVAEAGRGKMSVTIFRLPMVYGPGCKGNLPRMIRAISSGKFPPFPETHNRRSMVDVRDVVRAALLAVSNPAAYSQIYIVTDGRTYSTRQIYESICSELGITIPKWTVPLPWLRAVAWSGEIFEKIFRRRFFLNSDELHKLTDSAWYSSEKISRDLGYRPRYSLQDSLPDLVNELKKVI